MEDQWSQEQRDLKRRCVLEDPPEILEKLENGTLVVCGLDISYFENEKDGIAGASLVRIGHPATNRQCEVLDHRIAEVSTNVEYKAHFLAFREVPAYNMAFPVFKDFYEKADVLMIDSNGTLHPKRFGLACHFGVIMDKPTLGVAKNLQQLSTEANNMPSNIVSATKQKKEIKKRLSGKGKGEFVYLYGADGSRDGAAVICGKSVNPIYVSPGHRMTLETAIKIAFLTSVYRVPEPTRKADEVSRLEVQRRQPPKE